jgi:serine/threonine-protein kinase HipA
MAKTTRRVRVALGEALRPVGDLVFEADGRRETCMFRYGADWLADSARFAIAPTLPLAETPFYSAATREHPRSALPGPIADGAPDSWGRGLIRKALPGVLTELDYLLAVDDATRQGALRYVDDAGLPLARTYPPTPRLVELDELRRLAGLKADALNRDPAARERLLGSAGSLGGARPKASVRDRTGELAIAKFTSAADTLPIERAEVATLQLARAAGLNAASARIELGDTDRPVALIGRFDRADGDRVHYLSAQSFIGAERATAAYYTDIADALRAHALDARAQLTELFRRILFTVLVSNNDDHLKNHGLLHAGEGFWVLSPAFDINPQPHRRRHLETGISEISGSAASIEAAVDAAPFFDIERDVAAGMASRMVATIDERWRACCAAAGMSPGEIETYEPAFDHDESRIARQMDRK